jgi:hypothetical protein
MHAGELPVQDIADRFGVSRATVYRNAAGPDSPKGAQGAPNNRQSQRDGLAGPCNRLINLIRVTDRGSWGNLRGGRLAPPLSRVR